jgi:hypothetical protein
MTKKSEKNWKNLLHNILTEFQLLLTHSFWHKFHALKIGVYAFPTQQLPIRCLSKQEAMRAVPNTGSRISPISRVIQHRREVAIIREQ